MEANGDWLERLQDAINAKGDFLENHELPRLKKQVALYQTYFENIFNILVRKSLVQEDPYNYEKSITEVGAPSREEIREVDKNDQMRQRLAAFRAHLEYLNTYYQFSLGFLDLRRIRGMLDLINYVPWNSLTGSHGHSVSVILADYFRRINMGTDAMTTKLLRDMTSQIAHTMQFILAVLKDVTAFQRERYKLQFRKAVLPQLDLSAMSPDQAVKAAKPVFARAMPGAAYYPELVREVAAEEASPQSEGLKEAILQKLAVVEDKPKKKTKTSHKGILIQAVRLLAASGFQLEDIISKLTDNHETMMSRRVSPLKKLVRWLREIFGAGRFEQVYEVEMVSSQTSAKTYERIDFGQLMNELRNKVKLFSALSREDSIASRQLRAASEEKIYGFLNRNLSSLQTVHRQLMGLNDHFKKAFQGDRSARHRGMRVELAAIKNSIVKCNQKKHEYVAAKEEREQLEKLGVGEKAGQPAGDSA